MSAVSDLLLRVPLGDKRVGGVSADSATSAAAATAAVRRCILQDEVVLREHIGDLGLSSLDFFLPIFGRGGWRGRAKKTERKTEEAFFSGMQYETVTNKEELCCLNHSRCKFFPFQPRRAVMYKCGMLFLGDLSVGTYVDDLRLDVLERLPQGLQLQRVPHVGVQDKDLEWFQAQGSGDWRYLHLGHHHIIIDVFGDRLNSPCCGCRRGARSSSAPS